MKNFELTGNRVAIELADTQGKSSGGIIMPQTADTAGMFKHGTIVHVSKGYQVGETWVPINLRAGQLVIFDDRCPDKVTVNGRDFVVVREQEVVGTFEAE